MDKLALKAGELILFPKMVKVVIGLVEDLKTGESQVLLRGRST